MPQLDLKYSDDLQFKTAEIFSAIESALKELDESSGICKCRAYPGS